MIPQTLSELYPPETPLSEVHPDFHGMRLHKWKLLKITQEADEYRKSLGPDAPKPLAGQREWRPADSYGWKSI